VQSRASPAAFVLTLLFGLSVLGVPAAVGATAPAENIVVVAVSGDVRVAIQGATRAVRAGSALATPAMIRTGRDGHIELRQGGTTATVASDSEIEIAAPDARNGLVERIAQTRGNVFYDVAKRSGRKLRVETPYLVAVIKGTQFNVAAQPDSATVSLFEGRLEIWTPDAADVVELNAGEIATRNRNDRSIRVLRMDTGETIRARTDTPSDGTRSAAASAELADSRPASVAANMDIAGDRSSPLYSPVSVLPRNPGTATVSPTIEPVLGSDDLKNVSGAIRAETTVNAGIELGGPSAVAVGADVVATINVADTVAVTTDTAASVDLGNGSVAASTGATVDLAGTAIDAGVTVAADVPSGTVDLGTNVSVADTTVATTAAIDAGAGTIDAGVAAGPVDASVGVDLGTASATVDVAGTTITTPSIPVAPVVDQVVAPLRGLLGR
jgi:hypothetical protein